MGLIEILLCFSIDEMNSLIHHSWVPADVFNVKYLTLLALLFAVLQLHQPFQGPPTVVYSYSEITRAVGVFGGEKSCWLLSIFWPTLMISHFLKNILVRRNNWRNKYTILVYQICHCLVSTGVFDCCLLFVVCWLLFVDCWLYYCLKEYVDCCIFIICWCDTEFFMANHYESYAVCQLQHPPDHSTPQYHPINQLLWWLERECNGYCCLWWFLWLHWHCCRQEYPAAVQKITSDQLKVLLLP